MFRVQVVGCAEVGKAAPTPYHVSWQGG